MGSSDEALAEMLELNQALFESMPLGVVYWNAEGAVISANPAAQKIFGYTFDQAQGAWVDPCWCTVHEDGSNFPAADHPALQALRSGQNVQDVTMGLVNPAGGATRWISINANPQFKNAGTQPAGVIVIFTDITARKQADLELEIVHDHAAENLEFIQDAFYSLDLQGRFTYVNQKSAALWEKQPGEMLGKTIRELFPSGSEHESYRYIRQAQVDKKPVRYETYSEILNQWLETNIYPTRNGVSVYFHDITARKQSEETLRRYQVLAQNSRDIILFVRHRDGVILEGNRAALLAYGYTREELLARTIRDLRAPHTVAMVSSQMGTANTDGILFETVHVRKNGEAFPVEVSSRGIHIGQDEVLISIIRDITDRKIAEEALRESKERFSQFFYASPSGINIMRLEDGLSLDVNNMFADTLGYSREEVIGHTEARLNLFVDPAQRLTMLKTLREKGSLQGYEVRMRKKSGEELTMLGSLEVVEIKGEQVVLIQVTDITERKQAEQALRESEERYRLIIENATIGIVVHVDNKIVYSNRASLKMIGADRIEDLQGKNIIEFIHPEDCPMVIDLVRRAFTQAPQEQVESPFTIEERLVKLDGSVITVEASAILVNFYGSTGLMIMMKDITSQKQAELEKENLREQLLQSQKMESVGRLAGGVAHDFNNLLGVIIGRAERALNRIPFSDPSYADIEEILSAAQRSAGLTRQLLAFARKQTVNPRVLELNDTVSEMLKMLKRLIGEDIDLAWNPGQGLQKVKMDPSQVDQLLANLVVNARDAINGVGKVTIETCSVKFDEQYCAQHLEAVAGKYIMLGVSDNGSGMDRETRSHLFEPFFTTKEQGKGVGLGLATVYGIVKQNNGFINVYSEPGEGTTFKVYLPWTDAEVLADNHGANVEAPCPGTETILLVEDELALLELGQEILQDLGYCVLAANSPAEALRLAQTHAAGIHLLITDVVMPDMNGRELALKLNTIQPAMKCLFTSGYTADVIAHHGVLDKGIHFIQKPYLLKDLAAKVRQVIEQS